MTREGPIEHVFGFEEEEGGREEAELQKAHEMANNIERRGVLKDADFIEVRSEGRFPSTTITYLCHRISW